MRGVAHLWDWFAAKLSQFRADRRGNMLILFALSLIPMVGLSGLGIDYSMTLRAKLALDASTDAAVLAAATEASQVIQSQSAPGYDPTALAIQLGTAAGQNVFTANSAMVATQSRPTLTLNLQRQGFTITATGSYSAEWPTTFGQLFDTPTMGFSGHAASNLMLPKYMNIYVASDISQSMGIASTQANMSKLSGLTNGCVFGCHVLQNGQTQTNEQIAHSNNVELRIDVIKQSIQQMIASAAAVSSNKPTISIGLYTLQEYIPSDGANYYSRITAPTTDYTKLQALASAIDLGPNDAGGTGDTDFDKSVPLFNSKEVSTSGNGSGDTDRQNFVFLMTDGVQDIKGGGCTDGHCTKPFDPSLCAALRSKGVTIGVIYTTYIPFPTEQTYLDLVAPIQSQIGPNLQSCASPGYYYEASDGPAIRTAVNNLFTQAVSAGRLTQ